MTSPHHEIIRTTLDDLKHNLFQKRNSSVVEVCDDENDKDHSGPTMELAPIHTDMINAL